MNVNEVIGLAQWLNDHVQPALNVYEQLTAAMEQNANNGSKVPLREHLDAVEHALLAMPIEQLSFQQTDTLDEVSVFELLGEKGWRFVERTVKEGNFDPASAAADIRNAKQTVEKAVTLFNAARKALIAVGIQGEDEFESSTKVTVRIHFKEAVEISNIVQLKNRTADWYDISRGLAMAAGERPEDVEVKGATNGSVIIILGATLTVATLIALIMKQVASTIKSSMEIAHTLQDWKMRKVADSEVERVLLDRRKRIEDTGTEEALKLVKEQIGGEMVGDVQNALQKSIEKMFSFASKGGEVDLLPPPEPTEDEEVDDAIVEAVKTITETVEEMRTLKAATQLLIEDKTNEGQEGDELPTKDIGE